MPTVAEAVHAAKDERIRAVDRRLWRTRDIITAAIEDFADLWTTEFSFAFHDPNDVKELARWIRDYLIAAGHPAVETSDGGPIFGFPL